MSGGLAALDVEAVALDGGAYVTRCETVRVGRRSASAIGEIKDAEGRLYARGSTTCLVFEI